MNDSNYSGRCEHCDYSGPMPWEHYEEDGSFHRRATCPGCGRVAYKETIAPESAGNPKHPSDDGYTEVPVVPRPAGQSDT